MRVDDPAKKPHYTEPSVHWLVPVLLSTAAGAADVIGFLALGGLFTAHVTGNLCCRLLRIVKDDPERVTASMSLRCMDGEPVARVLLIVTSPFSLAVQQAFLPLHSPAVA